MHKREQILLNLLVGLVMAGLGGWYSVLEAKSMYVYVNDKGVSVMTDTLDHIPKKYRKSVHVFEMPEESELHEPSKTNETKSPLTDPIIPTDGISMILDKMPTMNVNTQTVMLVGGGLVILASFATMMFSRNMAIKFAMKWVLMMAIVGTGYGWYFSSMGLGGFLGTTGNGETGQKPIVEQVRDKTKMIEDIQNKKRMDFEKILGEGGGPPQKRKP